MISFELPAPRGGDWIGVMLERHRIVGVEMDTVTIRGRASQKIERRWFTDAGIAVAWAATQADSRHLPMFDFRDDGTE